MIMEQLERLRSLIVKTFREMAHESITPVIHNKHIDLLAGPLIIRNPWSRPNRLILLIDSSKARKIEDVVKFLNQVSDNHRKNNRTKTGKVEFIVFIVSTTGMNLFKDKLRGSFTLRNKNPWAKYILLDIDNKRMVYSNKQRTNDGIISERFAFLLSEWSNADGRNEDGFITGFKILIGVLLIELK